LVVNGEVSAEPHDITGPCHRPAGITVHPALAPFVTGA